jgi:hypothetical protein
MTDTAPIFAGPTFEEVNEIWITKQRHRFVTEHRRHPTTYVGCDLVAELRRFWRLPALQQPARSPLPALLVHHSEVKHGPWAVSGRAQYGRHRIVMTIGSETNLAAVLEVLLHEAVHLSLPGEKHSHRFILRLVRATAEAWSIDIPRPLETTERGRHGTLAYAVDERIRRELEKTFRDGCLLPPVVVPPPKASRAERMDRLRRERYEHSLAMLKRTERRLKIAQRRAKCWRAKVRYYEKVAAKRESAQS